MTWEDLCRRDQLLLWGMRTWVRHVKSGVCPHAALVEGLLPFGLEDAIDPLDTFLTTVADYAQGKIDVRCPQCQKVSADENTLIRFVNGCRSSGRSFSTDGMAGLVHARGMTECLRTAFLLAVASIYPSSSQKAGQFEPDAAFGHDEHYPFSQSQSVH